MAVVVVENKAEALLADIRETFHDDRVGFCRAVLRREPDEQQQEVLKALDTEDHVTARSGHGVGKSFTAAVAGWHFLICREEPKIPCTAPSQHQLFDILLPELAKIHKGMNEAVASLFSRTREKIYRRGFDETWFLALRTANKDNPENLQGFHARNILRIIEEASGVPDSIFEVLEGATGTEETKTLMIGNPTKLTGEFHRSHTDENAKHFFKQIHLSCRKSKWVQPRYIARMVDKYGLNSNIVRVRVEGKFPLRDGDSFIPYDIVSDAVERDIISQHEYRKVMGIDVARFGDDETVFTVRQNDLVYPQMVHRQLDTMQVVRESVIEANKFKVDVIFVDVIGIGAGVFDRLKEMNLPCEVIAVNVSESPSNKSKYRKLRDELYGDMRDWFEMRRCSLPRESGDVDSLVGEITTPKYQVNSAGQIVIESKREMKKRGVQSPNRSDSLMLTFAMPTIEYQTPHDKMMRRIMGDNEREDNAALDEETGW